MVLYKLVVLGDGGVGKTALTIQLCLQHFVETVSFSFSSALVARRNDCLSSPPPPRGISVRGGCFSRETYRLTSWLPPKTV